jgi:REP element-mobilizing transposase RayT
MDHCVARCVRRALLFGTDHHTNANFNHRKHLLENRIQLLADAFAVSIHSYAVMSNHFHLVCSMVPNVARDWTAAEVAERWLKDRGD